MGPRDILCIKIDHVFWGVWIRAPQNILQLNQMATNTTSTITTTFKSTRKLNAWSIFQRREKAANSPGYQAATNKSSFCSTLYKQLYTTKEAKDAYFQREVLADPSLQQELAAEAAATVLNIVAATGKKPRLSARDQFQKEWYAALRVELGTEKTGLRPTECAAAWKLVPEAEKVALKQRRAAQLARA